MNEKPTVSVICPIYNEARYIATCIDSILSQDYPREKIEVMIVDGGSTDNSKNIVENYISKFHFIQLVDNPHRVVPFALNIGIGASSGEVIIRLDAHCIYPHNYISTLVDKLIELKADNVGGVWKTLPANDTLLCKAIAIGSSHPFGIGNSLHKIGTGKIVETDTVPFGCFRRDIFDRIGLFDTDLIRNQDDEFSARIIKNGGSIYLIPSIEIKYFARDSLSKMRRMFYQYGLFKPLVLKKLGYPATSRQFFPLIFVLVLIIGFGISIFSHEALLFPIGILALYFATSIILSVIQAVKERNSLLLFILPYIFLAIHLSYGWGYIVGIVRFLIFGKKYSKVNITR